MLKQFFIIFTVVAILFSCTTINKTEPKEEIKESISFDTQVTNSYSHSTEDTEKKVNVIDDADPIFGDFASMILDLINSKDWEGVSMYSDQELKDSYLFDDKIEVEDYCMYLLNTGEQGISTSYSLNEIDEAYYTGTYEVENQAIFYGNFLYPTGETEYFRLVITNDDAELYITKE